MTHELYPQYFSQSDPTSSWKRALIERADHIIAISKATRKDLIRLWKVDPARVDSVYLASSIEPVVGEHTMNLPERFILYVGSRERYKNFYGFDAAVSRLMKKDKSLHLVCAGGGEFTELELDRFTYYGIGERTHQFNCSDEELAEFYSRAIVFAYPSLYEGFGLPIVEAFSCGCPVVCGNQGSLPEVAGNAAMTFDPLSQKEMEAAVRKVVQSPSMRKRLTAKGKKRANFFDWKKTTAQTMKIYESLK